MPFLRFGALLLLRLCLRFKFRAVQNIDYAVGSPESRYDLRIKITQAGDRAADQRRKDNERKQIADGKVSGLDQQYGAVNDVEEGSGHDGHDERREEPADVGRADGNVDRLVDTATVPILFELLVRIGLHGSDALQCFFYDDVGLCQLLLPCFGHAAQVLAEEHGRHDHGREDKQTHQGELVHGRQNVGDGPYQNDDLPGELGQREGKHPLDLRDVVRDPAGNFTYPAALEKGNVEVEDLTEQVLSQGSHGALADHGLDTHPQKAEGCLDDDHHGEQREDLVDRKSVFTLALEDIDGLARQLEDGEEHQTADGEDDETE